MCTDYWRATFLDGSVTRSILSYWRSRHLEPNSNAERCWNRLNGDDRPLQHLLYHHYCVDTALSIQCIQKSIAVEWMHQRLEHRVLPLGQYNQHYNSHSVLSSRILGVSVFWYTKVGFFVDLGCTLFLQEKGAPNQL